VFTELCCTSPARDNSVRAVVSGHLGSTESWDNWNERPQVRWGVAVEKGVAGHASRIRDWLPWGAERRHERAQAQLRGVFVIQPSSSRYSILIIYSPFRFRQLAPVWWFGLIVLLVVILSDIDSWIPCPVPFSPVECSLPCFLFAPRCWSPPASLLHLSTSSPQVRWCFLRIVRTIVQRPRALDSLYRHPSTTLAACSNCVIALPGEALVDNPVATIDSVAAVNDDRSFHRVELLLVISSQSVTTRAADASSKLVAPISAPRSWRPSMTGMARAFRISSVPGLNARPSTTMPLGRFWRTDLP